MGSLVFRYAIAQYHAIRAEYDDLLHAAYVLAEKETTGMLLNARGVAKGIDAITLFMGPETRAHAYASEELLAHWERRPRITFAQYERERFEGPDV